MLEIRALTYNDLPPVLPIAGTISGSGATVGRGAENVITLPDPAALVSRRHLRFDLDAAGAYRITNISGGNMMFVNDDELKPGESCPLRDQDKLSLGGYVLQVRCAAQAQPQPRPQPQPQPVVEIPGDDFLASLTADAARLAPAASLPEGGDPLGTLMYGGAADDRRDPMQALNERGVELGSLDSRGDELIRGESAGNMARELVSDPLSDTAADRRLAHDASLDPLAMFGEGGAGGTGGVFDDILQFGKNSGAGAAAHMDLTHGPDLGSLFTLPAPSGQPPVAPPSGAGASASPPPGGAERIGDLGGIDDLLAPRPSPPSSLPDVGKNALPPLGGGERIGDLGNIDDLIAGLAPGGKQEAPMLGAPLPDGGRTASAVPAAVSEPARAAADSVVPPASISPASISPASIPPASIPPQSVRRPVAQPAPQSAPGAASRLEPAPARAAASPDAEELCKAFIEGLGIDLPGRTVLDKTFMKMLGRMIRNYTQGTLDLIASRAIVKQEVRANVTLIAPERNNPLKFSSDGNAALLYLLGKPFPGFMEPVEAVKSAFTDLRAHQIGLVSGMRSAFNHVLQCFDPALIDNDNPARGLLDQAMPSWRKARLWDAYGRYFAETQASVTDRFQSFFGTAFVKAYEDAISALQSGKETGKP
ncbi:MAG: type VI secretion system-associated FHA domain protein TagH [Azoarcus sp.]|jgi:predicted component of type VI protein secretion system|nr:type VI secretion system-associated FHA domain protein TagH [Azoarcus sp.]